MTGPVAEDLHDASELLGATGRDGAVRRVALAGGRDGSEVSPAAARDVSGEASRDACGWCRGPIPARARRDSKYCSKRCRQASHRFGIGAVARRRTTDPMRIAYADPPYPGLSRKYYRDHPDFGGEVDHAELLDRLVTYDAWALSTSARALPRVLTLAVAREPEVRVAAWVRGARPHATATGPRSAWEPVIYLPGRAVVPAGATGRDSGDASRSAALDALVHGVSPRITDPARVVGAKPAAFCYWLFDLLGALPGDDFTDFFPGSGGVSRAWARYIERSATGSTSAAVRGDASD